MCIGSCCVVIFLKTRSKTKQKTACISPPPSHPTEVLSPYDAAPLPPMVEVRARQARREAEEEDRKLHELQLASLREHEESERARSEQWRKELAEAAQAAAASSSSSPAMAVAAAAAVAATAPPESPRPSPMSLAQTPFGGVSSLTRRSPSLSARPTPSWACVASPSMPALSPAISGQGARGNFSPALPAFQLASPAMAAVALGFPRATGSPSMPSLDAGMQSIPSLNLDHQQHLQQQQQLQQQRLQQQQQEQHRELMDALVQPPHQPFLPELSAAAEAREQRTAARVMKLVAAREYSDKLDKGERVVVGVVRSELLPLVQEQCLSDDEVRVSCAAASQCTVLAVAYHAVSTPLHSPDRFEIQSNTQDAMMEDDDEDGQSRAVAVRRRAEAQAAIQRCLNVRSLLLTRNHSCEVYVTHGAGKVCLMEEHGHSVPALESMERYVEPVDAYKGHAELSSSRNQGDVQALIGLPQSVSVGSVKEKKDGGTPVSGWAGVCVCCVCVFKSIAPQAQQTTPLDWFREPTKWWRCGVSWTEMSTRRWCGACTGPSSRSWRATLVSAPRRSVRASLCSVPLSSAGRWMCWRSTDECASDAQHAGRLLCSAKAGRKRSRTCTRPSRQYKGCAQGAQT